MTPNDALLAQDLRRHDYERYLLSLVAPRIARRALWAALAFNAELARIPDQVSQAVLGQMRLAWWRDATLKALRQGECGGNPVLLGLQTSAAAGLLEEAALISLVDGHERLLLRDPEASLETLDSDAGEIGVALARLRLQALGVDATSYDEIARRHGVAWELMRRLKALPRAASLGQVAIPADLGIDVPENLNDTAANRAALKTVVRHLSDCLATQIAQSRHGARWGRRLLPALGDGLFIARFLTRLKHCDYDIADPRMAGPDGLAPAALAWAWLRGGV